MFIWGNKMDLFIARAAQTAFNKAGYRKDDALRQGQQVAAYLLANLDECKRQYGIDDEFELAYCMARQQVSTRAGMVG